MLFCTLYVKVFYLSLLNTFHVLITHQFLLTFQDRIDNIIQGESFNIIILHNF